jgi:hypothetical protein
VWNGGLAEITDSVLKALHLRTDYASAYEQKYDLSARIYEEERAARADEKMTALQIVQSDEYRKGMEEEAERLVAAYPDLFTPPETAEQIADRRSEHRWAAIGKPGGGLHPEDAKSYRAPVRRRLPRERYVDDITTVLNKAAHQGSHLLGAVDAYED